MHLGHVKAVRWLLERVDEVIVGVTAAQYSYTPENPFTAGERIEMLRAAFREEWGRLFVVPLDNVPDNSLWLSYVASRVPSFEFVATGNEFVKLLARERGYEVLELPLWERDRLQGRVVRELMASGGEWRELVPPGVAEYLERIGAPERVRKIYLSERVKTPEY